jgi:hypothetical protein
MSEWLYSYYYVDRNLALVNSIDAVNEAAEDIRTIPLVQ